MRTDALPWRAAWERALYAGDGFFRRSRPADHFRTNAHVAAFGTAISEIVRSTGAKTVVDLGAGGGELLTSLHRELAGDVELVGVEVAERPDRLPDSIAWLNTLPDHVDGLLIANEWLDNVPCDVVEVDAEGLLRHVMVDPVTGIETLGEAYDPAWLHDWWPVTHPGERAEVGTTRDAAWSAAVARVTGTAIAIDYGHTRAARPPLGTLRSYARGREVDVVPDGSRDITAHVAIDSVADAVGATAVRQRDALLRLGLGSARPSLDLARSDPTAYVERLGRAAEVAELSAPGGLGDFWWIVTGPLGHGRLAT